MSDPIVPAVLAWARKFPEGSVDVEVVSGRDMGGEYTMDHEIVLAPRSDLALGVTVLSSGGAVGFTLDDRRRVAAMAGTDVSPREAGLPCGGTEPVYSLDVDTMLDICESVSAASVEVSAHVLLGRLRSVGTRIALASGRTLSFDVGMSRISRFAFGRAGVVVTRNVDPERWRSTHASPEAP